MHNSQQVAGHAAGRQGATAPASLATLSRAALFLAALTWPGRGTTDAWYTASRSAERSGRDMSRFEAVTRTTSCRTKAPSAPHCCCAACCAAGGCWSPACCAAPWSTRCCASAGGSRLLAGLPALMAALPSRSPSIRVGGRLSGWRALRDTALPVSRSARGGVSAEGAEQLLWLPCAVCCALPADAQAFG